MRLTRVLILVFVASLVATGHVVRADGPGTVLVLYERPMLVQFAVPVGVPYKLIFPDSRLGVWSSPQAFNSRRLSSDTVYVAGQGLYGDVNGDHTVDLTDLVAIKNTLGTITTETDLDENAFINAGDLTACRGVLGNGGDTLNVYVKGLSVSSALGDVTLQLLTDPDQDSEFTPAASRTFTVASITLAHLDPIWAEYDVYPWEGFLGSALTVTIDPAISPLVFDATTTATWTGVIFNPYPSRTPEITVEYSATQVHELNDSQALFLVGDGTNVGGQIGETPPWGEIFGPMTFHFSGVDVTWTFYFDAWSEFPDRTPTYFFSAAGGGGVGDPVFDVDLRVLDRSDPYWGDMKLEECTAAQYIATVIVEDNTLMQTLSLPALPLQIVTWDHAGQERSRTTVWMYPSGREDFGPLLKTFFSDWRRPIVFVAGHVDPATCPDLTVIEVDPDGFYYDFRIR